MNQDGPRTYRGRRRFDRTAEPRGRDAASSASPTDDPCLMAEGEGGAEAGSDGANGADEADGGDGT